MAEPKKGPPMPDKPPIAPVDDAERPKDAPHIEDLIDESVEESFPASDPPAVSPNRKPPAVDQ